MPWMIARRLLICLLALLTPLAFGVLSVRATASAATMPAAAMASMASMADCNDSGPKPAKAPACADDCILLCATAGLPSSDLASPIRPYARLRYDRPLIAPVSRVPKPELPPPRSSPEATMDVQFNQGNQT